MSDARSEALRRALEVAPVSRREVSRRAGVSHSTLNRIAANRQRVTAAQAIAVAEALREIGELCEAGANEITVTLEDDE